jgi:hypothetical protein
MKLLDYLNRYFSNGKSAPDFNDEGIVLHFAEKFGVNVKTEEGGLFQFKYSPISAKWSRNIVSECRGTILRFTPNYGWVCCARPFDKFWNQHELACPYNDPKLFDASLGQFSFSEKIDGTCILLWWDPVLVRWRVSTLGCISTSFVADLVGVTFEDLFWRTIDKDRVLSFFEPLGRDYTGIFELYTAENRILTKYSSDRVYLLAIRGNIHGDYGLFSSD